LISLIKIENDESNNKEKKLSLIIKLIKKILKISKKSNIRDFYIQKKYLNEIKNKRIL